MEKKKKPLLIIPAFNEEENIEKIVQNLEEHYPQYDYVVINDGSTDHTGEICEEKGFNVVNLPINLGIGGAVQTGYRYAKKYGYAVAVQIDGDGQHDVSFVEKVVQPILDGKANVVVGSRFLEREGFQSSASRRMGIGILSALIRLCTGVQVKDVTSGFRAVDRRFIEIYAADYPSDYPEPEAVITAVMYHGKIKEVPVVMRERQNGESSIDFRKSVYYMIKVTLAILIRRISYGVRR